jgi:hypothetical protein
MNNNVFLTVYLVFIAVSFIVLKDGFLAINYCQRLY